MNAERLTSRVTDAHVAASQAIEEQGCRQEHQAIVGRQDPFMLDGEISPDLCLKF
jgi:hypothetical protein